MTYTIYEMTFKSAHFGEGPLEVSTLTFSADRLFSALVIQAVKLGKNEEFQKEWEKDEFVLSDAFPMKDKKPYLPKPIGYPNSDILEKLNKDKSIEEVRKKAKASKKLQFLPFDKIDSFVKGELNEDDSKVDFAEHSYVTKNQPLKDGALFQIGIMTYYPNISLYVIATQSEILDELFKALQFSGLGGRRSSGYGLFELKILEVPQKLKNRLTVEESGKVMSLTTSLPVNDDLVNDDLVNDDLSEPVNDDLSDAMTNGHYLLKRTSGFAQSDQGNKNVRKKDIYKLKSGSTFSKTYKGSIINLNENKNGNIDHPIWNYAKPLFYKLEDEVNEELSQI